VIESKFPNRRLPDVRNLPDPDPARKASSGIDGYRIRFFANISSNTFTVRNALKMLDVAD
jgi:hypothetical protein